LRRSENSRNTDKISQTRCGRIEQRKTAQIRAYFENLGSAVKLSARWHKPSARDAAHVEQLAFINQAVHSTGALFVCTGPRTYDGWYAKLDYAIMPNVA